MSTGTYANDRILIPITIATGSNDTIQIEEDSGSCVITITLEAGTWYLHDDDSLHATYPGLYRAIRYLTAQATGTYTGYGSVAVTGTKTNSYTWAAVDPTSSTSMTGLGLRLNGYNAVSADAFIIDVSDSTMDMRWFGQLTAVPADPTSGGSGTDKYIDSPGTRFGDWIPYGIDGFATAVEKDPVPWRIAQYSSDKIADSQAVIWGTGKLRHFQYQYIHSAHVHEERADQTGYASQGDLATGDKNNTFHSVWERLTAMGVCIVVHDDISDLQVDSHDYEVIKLAASSPDWEQFVSRQRSGGDFYRVDFRAFRIAGTYAH